MKKSTGNFKKTLSGFMVIFLALSAVSAGCGKKDQTENQSVNSANNEEIEVPFEKNADAQLTQDQSENLQTSLMMLSDLYLKATIATNSTLSATPKNTSYEDWRKEIGESADAWEKLETKLKNFENLTIDIENTGKSAAKPTAYENKESSLFPTAFAKEAPAPALVTAVFDSAPQNTNSLKNLMDFFGWDAKTALKQLKIAQDQIEADAWTEEGDSMEMLQNQAKILSDSMKVSLMIGGMIVTAGSTTPLIAGSAGSIFTKGALILEGSDLAMSIGEDAMIAFGNDAGEAIIKQKHDKISVPCKILSIIKLKDLGDPGNLITITELATEYGQKVLDWGKSMRADMDVTSGFNNQSSQNPNLRFRKSDLTGDLPAFNPEDLERFRLETKKAWEELKMPEVIAQAEREMKEQKKSVDAEIAKFGQQLDEYLKQKAQIEYDLEILKSMEGGSFSSVDAKARTKLNKQLEEINKKISDLKEKIKQKENLSESLDLTDEDSEDDEEETAKYPETLYAKGTWTSSRGGSAPINIDFPSAGGSFSGGFSACPNGICWSSTVSGTFDGNDPGKVSGTVSGSVAATEYTPKFTISGTFNGNVSLKDGTVKGTFSNSISDTSGKYGTYTDAGNWSATFDNGQ